MPTAKATRTATPTKSATLRALLARPDGASLAALCAATGWQPHSVRAALSGLRKAGCTITRTPGKAAEGETESRAATTGTVYRLTSGPEEAA